MALTDVIVPVAGLALSLTLTWRFCLRPMRDGQHCAMGSRPDGQRGAASEARDAEVARLRQEISELTGTAPRTERSAR